MAPLGPWPAWRQVAVAVSGGADSLCLAYLTASWGNPLALIVDHGLRPESADEAEATSRLMASLHIPNRILTLRGLSPGPALAARARAARYAALSVAARQAGCSDLLLGHHRLDQAETVLMRRQAHSGPAGLAGMAWITETHDLRLVRPLLGVPPGRLRATLRAAGLAWVEDPSNRNPAALRTRLRDALADPDGTSERTTGLVEEAACHANARRAQEQASAEVLAERVSIRPEGYALLSPGALPAPALAALIRTIGGNPYAASTRALQKLAANPAPAVLDGVRLLSAGRLGPGLLLVREEAAMAQDVPACPGAVWDRRFRLAHDIALPEGTTLGAVGGDASAFRRTTNLPAAVLRTLPALRLHGMLAAVPHIGYVADCAFARVAVWFSPAHPLCGAPFGVPHGGCEGQGAPPC